MRHVYTTALVAVSALIPFESAGQAPVLSVTNYQPVSEIRVSRTVSDFLYRADLTNSGPSRTAVTAHVTSKVPGIEVIHGTLHFRNVPGSGRVTSSDTLILRLDRTVAVDFAGLQWTFAPAEAPAANAGSDQTRPAGATVTLNGSGSSNPGGQGTLSYSWGFASRPPGSAAVLNDPESVSPTFQIDVAGTYVLALKVSNGVAADSATVTISTENTTPVARPGPNKTVAAGSAVRLNGSRSFDVDGNPLTYTWTFVQRPDGSTAALEAASSVAPAFRADKDGTYVVQLIVSDGKTSSAPATVQITTANTAPVANAGPSQIVDLDGVPVQLDGSRSTDVDGDALTYRWSLITVPAGSTAALSSATAVMPDFTPDVEGTYIAQLIVDDGRVSSSAATVVISTSDLDVPSAAAGSDQTVKQGSQVTLDGTGTDSLGRPLEFQWTLLSKPSGSTARFSTATEAQPTFTADAAGDYVAQLIVNNGVANSVPATVKITTINTAPAAVAATDESELLPGKIVALDASGSSDPDADALTYKWSFTNRPEGSRAALSAANSPTPTFVADVPGIYVAQLIVSDKFASTDTPDTLAIAVPAGIPATITVTSGSPQGTPINKAFPKRLVATVKDATGKPVSGVTVRFVLPPLGSGPRASFPGGANTAITNASGVATSNQLTANGITGTYNVNGRVTGVAAAAVFTLTNTVPAASITVTSGSGQSTQIKTAFDNRLVATVRDGGGNPIRGITVTFVSPAPGSGPRASFAGGVNTAVTNVAGVATSRILTANGIAGSYTVNGRVTGVATPAAFALTNTPGPPASITATSGSGQSTPINTAFANRLVATVKDASGNPVGGVTVTFVMPPPGSGPRASFPGGANTAVTNASGVARSNVLTANGIAGSYNANARVAGVAAPAVFALTNTAAPAASITATSGSGQITLINTAFANRLVATVKDAGGNPVSGVTVTFDPPATGASGSFTGGNTAVTNGSGAATSNVFTANGIAGSYNVNARVTGVAAPAVFALTNTGASQGQLMLSGATVGQNLQTTVTLTLPQVAPAGGRAVTITSGNPAAVKLAAAPAAAGANQITVTVPQGQTSASNIYVQGFVGSGTVQIVASSPGFTNGTATVNLRPAGFVLAGPAGIGVSSFNVPQGTNNTQLMVSAGQLDASLNYVTTQEVRGGMTASVVISNSTPAVGTISPTTVVIAGGASTGTTTFNALTPGNTVMTAAAPAGFVVPAGGFNTVVGIVFSSGLLAPTVTVGQNLETSGSIRVNTAPSGTVPVTVTSNDPSKLRFSLTPEAAGTSSISLNIEAGTLGTPVFFIHGLVSAGSATYTAMATGYGTSTGTANFAPSGFVIEVPSSSFTTTTGAENTEISIQPYRLSAGAPAVAQAVRGGTSVNVVVTSSNPGVGTITTSPVVFNGGTSEAATQFDPLSNGTTTISINTPTGFTTPASGTSRVATVITPSLSLTYPDGHPIGRNLQASGIVLLGQPAPAGGISVQITSNSGQLQLAKQATDAGSSSITIPIAAGESSAVYYLHALDDSGTATYTATAPGYVSKTGTMSMAPSGVTISGPFGFGFPLTATVGGGPEPVSLLTARLGPGDSPAEYQALAGGLSLTVQLNNSNPGVGTVPNQAVISGGAGSEGNPAQVNFAPSTVGTTLISVVTPAGYTQPAANTTLAAQVSP